MVKGSIEWEHSEEEGLVLRIKPSVGEIMTGDILQHAMAARTEILLALRSLIDIAVSRTGEKGNKTRKPMTKIKVD